MTFEIIQNRIAEKIGKLNNEIKTLESVDMDYESPHAARIDNRLRALMENSDLLENLAFFIISQNDELMLLREQSDRIQIRLAALLAMAERATLRTNAAQAVSSLLHAKRDYLTREIEVWLKTELGEEDYNLLTIAA